MASAADEDRISELPDEILHLLLRRVDSPKLAAQTSILSRRWRTLWRTYPVVEFDVYELSYAASTAASRQFCDAAVERLSRPYESFRLESFDVSLRVKEGTKRSGALNRLLDLATQRKTEEVAVMIQEEYSGGSKTSLRLPFRALSIPGAKTISLTGVGFTSSHESRRVPLSLSSLRSLRLKRVKIKDRLFNTIIASAPLLETLLIKDFFQLKKLRLVSDTLKTLRISNPYDLEKIEIAAPGLKALRLDGLDRGVSIKSIKVPQLEILELEYWDFDVAPFLADFVMIPFRFKKFEIRNAAADCRLELDFCELNSRHLDPDWSVQLQSLTTRVFSQFQVVNVSF